MKILVYDVAAEDGGGLFVLKNFYNDIKEKAPQHIEWIVMTSLDIFEDTEHIKIMSFPEVKKSWMHRLKFENLELPRIIEGIKPDLIISLQNMPVSKCKCRQLVYMHQSLQYCPKRFSFFKKEERALAIRQHLICGLIKKNLPKAEHIFVQTNWIKEATCDWIKCPKEKVTIVPVTIDYSTVPIEEYRGQESKVFFYPARAEMYKNHEVIIEACKLMVDENIEDYKIIFTISPEEGAYAKQVIERAKGLPIECIGSVPYAKIWEFYRNTILLFPSYLETCGVPMMEAKAAGTRILASDMPFSHEALDGYGNVEFFEFDNSSELAEKMKKFILEPKYQEVSDNKQSTAISLMECMLDYCEGN